MQFALPLQPKTSFFLVDEKKRGGGFRFPRWAVPRGIREEFCFSPPDLPSEVTHDHALRSPAMVARSLLSAATLASLALSATGFMAPSAAVVSTHRCAAASMKVFDWERRGTEAPEMESLDLSNLQVSPGSHKGKTRKGRGISAGQGATCGFGTRGQKSRSGRGTRPGFEGGQIPLYRRLPKFVGRPMGPGHSKTLYGIVKLNVLNTAGDTVDYSSLQEAKLVSKSKCAPPRHSSRATGSLPCTAATGSHTRRLAACARRLPAGT